MGFLGGLVGSAGGSSLLDFVKDTATNYINNYYARKNASKEFQRNVDLWNLENEYNKPVNQMARLKEAGLNPNLVYGSGATTLAASTHGAPRSTESWQGVKAGFMDTINAYQDLRQKDATTENLKIQNELLRQQERVAKKDADIYLNTGVHPARSSGNILSAFSQNVGPAAREGLVRFLDWFNREPKTNIDGSPNPGYKKLTPRQQKKYDEIRRRYDF